MRCLLDIYFLYRIVNSGTFAVIQLTFANSSLHQGDLLTEFNDLLLSSTRENGGYFGLFLLDMKSLRLVATGNETHSTHEGVKDNLDFCFSLINNFEFFDVSSYIIVKPKEHLNATKSNAPN